MNAIVVFSSQTGNTEMLARTVHETLGGEALLARTQSAPDPGGFDLVAVGFWLKAGKPDPVSADYLSRVGKRKLFLFATHGADPDSGHARNAMEHARSLAPDAEILGTFHCQGEVAPPFLEKVQAKDPRPPWVDAAPSAAGHPDADDLERLRQRVREANRQEPFSGGL
jgi:flavodoxin